MNAPEQKKPETQEEHEANCKLCNRVPGIPILLTRYAIAAQKAEGSWYGEKTAQPAPLSFKDMLNNNQLKSKTEFLEGMRNKWPDILDSSWAPKISGQFKVEENIALGKDAHYTLRLLREGFVYLYDESLKKWYCHTVSGDGYLAEINISKGASSAEIDPRAAPHPCKPLSAGCLARVITVPIPKGHTPGTIWVSYSAVKWTDAVLQRHQDATWRKKHMRSFRLGAWVAQPKAPGAPQPHSASIQDVGKHVADYNHANFKNIDAFSTPLATQGWAGLNPLNTADANTLNAIRSPERLIRKCEEFSPGKGLILALDDPLGIAMDLTGLRVARCEAFEKQKPTHSPSQRPTTSCRSWASSRRVPKGITCMNHGYVVANTQKARTRSKPSTRTPLRPPLSGVRESWVLT